MSLKDEIYNKNKKLILVCLKLQRFGKKLVETHLDINTMKDGVACFVLAKTLKTYTVIIKLIKEGYGEDAEMLSRTLFDAAVIISACLKDKTNQTVQKYLSFDYPTRNKMFNQLQKNEKYKKYFQERQKSPKPNDELVEDISQRSSEFIDQYGSDFRQKWHSGMTTSQIADSVNLIHYYQTAWQLQSQLVHCNPRCQNRYLKIRNRKIIMSIVPSTESTDISLVSSFNMMFVVCNEFRKHFKISADKELEALVNEYAESVK